MLGYFGNCQSIPTGCVYIRSLRYNVNGVDAFMSSRNGNVFIDRSSGRSLEKFGITPVNTGSSTIYTIYDWKFKKTPKQNSRMAL